MLLRLRAKAIPKVSRQKPNESNTESKQIVIAKKTTPYCIREKTGYANEFKASWGYMALADPKQKQKIQSINNRQQDRITVGKKYSTTKWLGYKHIEFFNLFKNKNCTKDKQLN